MELLKKLYNITSSYSKPLTEYTVKHIELGISSSSACFKPYSSLTKITLKKPPLY